MQKLHILPLSLVNLKRYFALGECYDIFKNTFVGNLHNNHCKITFNHLGLKHLTYERDKV